jgi:cytochrome c biogenesis protein CcmG/thiol:disulfide interchange protein DsbE
VTAPVRTVRVALAVLATAGLLAGCTAGAAKEPAPVPSSGAAYSLPSCPSLEPAEPVDGGLPDLELPCLGGGSPVNLADLRGTPMVLNVWAAWCVNCDREMPLFARAMAEGGDRVRFFGVHYKAAEKYGERSAADFGVPFPSVHDEDGDKVAQALKATAPPQTLFVSADGKVMGREVGEITSQAELDGLVRRYLGVRL